MQTCVSILISISSRTGCITDNAEANLKNCTIDVAEEFECKTKQSISKEVL